MKPYYYILRLGAVAASLATLAALLGLVATSAIPGLLVMVAMLSSVSYAIKPLVERPQRPQGPGWRWDKGLRCWTNGLGTLVTHSAAPRIEDEIDAAVAAWKTVYGEDIGYNEHAVTLEWLGSLYRSNVLTAEQMADCADNVEWLTWALAQPEQNEMLKHVGGPAAGPKVPGMPPRKLSCGCSATSANKNCRHNAILPQSAQEKHDRRIAKAREDMLHEHNCPCPDCTPVGGLNPLRERRINRGGGHRTLEQITRQLAELEDRAADTLRKVEAGTLSVNEARRLIEGQNEAVRYLGAQRQAITGEPYPFDHSAYQAHVDRFTAMARPASDAIAQADRRVSEDVFEKMRQQLGIPHDQHRQAVLEAGTCDGCATMLYSTDKGMGEQRYCDGSHTRERSLADTIHETATEGW